MSLWIRLAESLGCENRIARFRAVLEHRTDRIVPVFENLHKPHNASAVIRTCDALGVAYAHFIDETEDAQFSRNISKGSQNWVDTHIYASKDACFATLRNQGYALAATCLDEDAVAPDQLPMDKKIAVIFGNEREGVSAAALAAAEYKIAIPMFGFVDSFNVSVAAAIIFHAYLQKVRNLPQEFWGLSVKQKKKLMRRWLYRNTRLGKLLGNKARQKTLIEYRN